MHFLTKLTMSVQENDSIERNEAKENEDIFPAFEILLQFLYSIHFFLRCFQLLEAFRMHIYIRIYIEMYRLILIEVDLLSTFKDFFSKYFYRATLYLNSYIFCFTND